MPGQWSRRLAGLASGGLAWLAWEACLAGWRAGAGWLAGLPWSLTRTTLKEVGGYICMCVYNNSIHRDNHDNNSHSST